MPYKQRGPPATMAIVWRRRWEPGGFPTKVRPCRPPPPTSQACRMQGVSSRCGGMGPCSYRARAHGDPPANWRPVLCRRAWRGRLSVEDCERENVVHCVAWRKICEGGSSCSVPISRGPGQEGGSGRVPPSCEFCPGGGSGRLDGIVLALVASIFLSDLPLARGPGLGDRAPCRSPSLGRENGRVPSTVDVEHAEAEREM